MALEQQMGGVDPATKVAVELGGEHPGAMVDPNALAQAQQIAEQQAVQAMQAQDMIANSPAGKLLAFTHRPVKGSASTLLVPRPDLSADLVDKADANGNNILSKIAKQVLEGYGLDKRSRSDWEQRSAAAMDLALQVTENKSWPWQNAANVKLPLITTAAIQFHARAYPAIVPGQQIVKGVPVGHDPDGQKMERGDRVGKHMSYQVLEEMPEWEEDTDKLLLNVSIVGCAFRKTFFDQGIGANRSEMVVAKRLVVNHRTKNLTDARRITEELELYENDIEERMRSGRWRECDLSLKTFGEDDDPAHEFLECYTWYDLDGDGYREPYICVVHKDSQQVVRIMARFEAAGVTVDDQGRIVRIAPEHSYTKYSLIPNPDGGFYDIGLGYLLNPLNETANTVMNQLLDAGTLANTGGGFIGKGLRLKGGPVKLAPGEFQPVDAKGKDIRENIVPMVFPGPSPVLFQLLGMIIEQVREVASVKDVLTGQNVPANQPATTTLALIDQGLKVFTAIYKRLHRSLKQEFKKVYRLNSLYLDPEVYFQFQDVPAKVLQADYQRGDVDCVPITDPSVVAGPVKLIKAQALLGLKDDPRVNGQEIIRRFLDAIEEPMIDQLMAQPGPMDQMQMVGRAKMMALQMEKLQADIGQVLANTDETISKSIKTLIEAGVAGINGQAAILAGEIGNLSNWTQGAPNGKQVPAISGGPAVGPGDGGGTPGMA